MLLLPLPHCLLLSQVRMENNLERMDAPVTIVVVIICVLIVLVSQINFRQKEEEEKEAVRVITEMVEEVDLVPRINPVPLWRLGNTFLLKLYGTS